MSKNGINDLEFGHNMYYDDLYRFQKNWQNLRKMLNFWTKIVIFFICGSDFSLTVFGEKFMDMFFLIRPNEPKLPILFKIQPFSFISMSGNDNLGFNSK